MKTFALIVYIIGGLGFFFLWFRYLYQWGQRLDKRRRDLAIREAKRKNSESGYYKNQIIITDDTPWGLDGYTLADEKRMNEFFRLLKERDTKPLSK